ncbi:MAG: hypothetical protein ACREUU_02850, partial [Gammaproteobacteria bacterium]
FLLVVTARETNLVCDTCTLELFGLPCPPPRLVIDLEAASNKVVARWSSSYPDFRLQSVNSLGGPSPQVFINVTSPPVLVSGKFAVTNAVTTSRQFFRLAK